jgi:hypothetical protein
VVALRHSVRVAGPCHRRDISHPEKLLCGRDVTRMKLRISGQSVALVVDERYTGARVDDGEYTPPTGHHRRR